MGHYDHRVHAGNAGDVWKHFLLLEAADCLLAPDSRLVYAESHVGHPDYFLKPSGDWEGGIGRIWPIPPLLRDFPYFDILAEYIPAKSSPDDSIDNRQIERYPGSAWLMLKLAERKKVNIAAEIWDIDPAVQAAWEKYSKCPSLSFHLGDGFSGAMSLLDNMDKAATGLLLIDPPFIDQGDRIRAEELFCRARESGWTVLCWHMNTGRKNPSQDYETHTQNKIHELSIQFSQIGLEYAGAKGCSIRSASPDKLVIRRISGRIDAFLKIMNEFLLSKMPIGNDDRL